METTTATTLADMISANNTAPMIRVECAVVTPASGGFGQFQVGEVSSADWADLTDWAAQLEFSADEYVAAESADGNTQNQNGMTIFADPNGSLHAIRFEALTQGDLDWAEAQCESVPANQADIKAFDASANGARYLAITGVTMWANLGGDMLPATAELAEELR